MRVTRAELERRLAELERDLADPRAGLWGPGTATWRLNRELINFVGGGRAALLQLAHPFVAQAIADHSDAVDDPRGRFRRTFTQMFAMTFGDREAAFSAARHVHGVHARIKGELSESAGAHRRGSRYAANDAAAIVWVHATLVDTVLVVHDRLAGGVSAADKDRYYQESKRGAALFGIAPEALPVDYPAFRAYMRAHLSDGTIAVTRAARDIARALLEAPSPALAPAASVYRLLTGGLLPAPLREGFGFRFGPAERLGFRAAMAATRAAYRAVPARARYLPAYAQAARRLGLDDGGRVTAAVERALAKLDFWPASAA